MLYTRKGDDGTTKNFSCDQRMTKGALLAEALGTVDELNTWLGYCKVKLRDSQIQRDNISLSDILEQIQQDLFIVQAELAGAPGKMLNQEKVKYLENIIDGIEGELPKITSFFVSGGTELSALCDYGRTIARRAERVLIRTIDKNEVSVCYETKAYMNRLSSLLYSFVRIINFKLGSEEQAPKYM